MKTRLTCLIILLACLGFMLGSCLGQTNGNYYFDRYTGSIFDEDDVTPAAKTILGFNGTPLRITKYTLSSDFDIVNGQLVFLGGGGSYQPLDSDLTAIAALTTTSFGRGLLELADAAALRTAAGLGTLATQSGTISDYLTIANAATTYQPLDSDLTAIAALTTTAYGRGLLDDADAAAARTTLGLGTLATQSGTISDYLTIANAAAGYQPLDADLTDLADGSLSGSKVGSGIDAANVTTGTLDLARLTLASQAEAEAGAINTKLMTPLRVAQAIAALAGAGSGDMLKSVYDPQNAGYITGANGPAGSNGFGGSLVMDAGSAGDADSFSGNGGNISAVGGNGDPGVINANGGNAGSVLANGGSGANDGATGYYGGAGGTLTMSGSNAEPGSNGLDGGNINTAAGGGSIHTLDGYIQLGPAGSRLTIQEAATDDWELRFPAAAGTAGQVLAIDSVASDVVTTEWIDAGGAIGSTQYARLGSDATSSSTALANVTGMTATLEANGVYEVVVEGLHTTNTTTEALIVSLNGSAAASNVIFNSGTVPTVTTWSNLFTGTSYDEITPTLGTGPGATARPFFIRGMITNGASSSTLALRVRAETGGANSVTIKAGTVMIVRKLN